MITDPVQNFIVAMVAIVEGDAELRTLFGRTARIIVAWNTLAKSPLTPVLTWAPIVATESGDFRDQVEVQLTAFAKSEDIANKAVFQCKKILTNPAFAAKGIGAAPVQAHPRTRRWDGASAVESDNTEAQADVTLAFTITV